MAISGDRKREYQRAYMQRRRAQAKAAASPDAKGAASSDRRCSFCASDGVPLWGGGALICEACAKRATAALAGGAAEEVKPAQPRTAKPKAAKPAPASKQPERHARGPEQPTKQQWADLGERMRADFAAFDRERALYGGRRRHIVVADIERLLISKGGLSPERDAAVMEAISIAMLPHVAQQANIETGISRRTFRKVLAEFHPDRGAADSSAFITFKGLDAKMDNGGRNDNSIVIPDAKVITMADIQRKREERSAKARAAAAKRKQSA